MDVRLAFRSPPFVVGRGCALRMFRQQIHGVTEVTDR
jgi:hypothetical protein